MFTRHRGKVGMQREESRMENAGEKTGVTHVQPHAVGKRQSKLVQWFDKWDGFHTKRGLHWRFILYSLILWLLLINYYERIVVKRALNICQWSQWENWPQGVESHKVALFADPQIMDNYSYPGRPFLVNYITRVILDHYHSRNWKYVQQYLNPDTNFFLGDLFDGGRNWEDDMWMEEYERFHKIFPQKPGKKTVSSLPGNHDIGFGDTVVADSFQRFRTFFGETSSLHDVGNHTFVLLDTIAMSDTANENISAVPYEFLKEYSNIEHPYPRILLTHVPLWRNSKEQTCGKMRESSKLFPIMKGLQYQTVIDQTISQNILTTVKPIHIFSGDDHDYCHIKHSYTNDGQMDHVDEITVKSCAMNMGISKPAIQLVSLFNDVEKNSGDTIRTQICYMPSPFKPIWMYIIAMIINFGFLVITTVTADTYNIFNDPLPMPIGINNAPFKDKGELPKLINVSHCRWSKEHIFTIVSNALIILLGIGYIFRYYYI